MAGQRQRFQSSVPTEATRVVRRRRQFAALLAVAGAAVVLVGVSGTVAASASQPQVNLGTAASFAVLAGSTVTNTGPSSISGDLGLYPGTAITGFPPGRLTSGTTYVAPSGVAEQAEADLTTAYDDAAGRTPPTLVSADLGGQTLAPGVYKATSSMGLTGTIILDGQNDLSSVFIFEAGSTLTTASNSTVQLINGAQACNVFWQVGSSATLGTTTSFVGSVLALTSATLDTGAVVDGRVLARNGAVTLDDNTITSPTCATAATTTTLTPTTTTIANSPTTTTRAGSPTTTTTPRRSTTTTTRPRHSTTTTTPARHSTTTTSIPKRGAVPTTTSVRPTRKRPKKTVTSVPTTTLLASGTTTTVPRSVTTTTSPGSTTTTSPGVPSTTIPISHTGEPWSGWPYWALISIVGLLGFAFVGHEALVRRRRT